jgi:hypothetical protein
MPLAVNGSTIKKHNDRNKQLIPGRDQFPEQIAVMFTCMGLAKFLLSLGK